MKSTHGLKLTFFLIAFCAALVSAKTIPARAEAPAVSLFFSEDESRQAEILAQREQPHGQGDIRLGAVMYYGPDDWAVWIQGEKWTPQTRRDGLRIDKVSENEVRLTCKAEDGSGERSFALRPNQSFQLSTGKIISGP